MRILFFTDILRAGGKERRIIELLKGLTQQGISCEIVVMSEDIQYPLIYQLGIPIHFMTYKIRKDPSPFWRFFNLCKKVKPDIIHSWSPMCTFYAIPTAQLLGIKLINSQLVNCYGYVKPFSKLWFGNNISFPFCDLITSNSECALDEFHPPKAKSACVYNGFDSIRLTNLASKDEIRAKYHIQTEMVVGMAASFWVNKDYESYILAALQILKTRQDVTFITMGEGYRLEECKNLVPEEYKSKILFLGKLQHVEEVMNICDIGTLISFREGLPNTILEFMALGKPIVASNVGGMKELVIHDVSGFLVPIKAVNQVVEKITKLLDSPELRLQMGESGKQRIAKEFSLSKMTEEYYQLYLRVMPRS